jgi:2-polyprenyl-6-methoxyphenol hydroxylase-like FAD-dependent oxidoreductase
MSERVVVIGGGVGGLTAALALARAGHEVTVLERDPLPPTADAEEAFAAERRGAPQVHQTHGFLARLQVELREHFPDVLADLLAAGGMTMPMTADLGEPRPGDEDLKVIIVRRTTFEWVLRKAVVAQPGVEVRTGVAVAGLLATSVKPQVRHADVGLQRPWLVTGVRLEDGSTIEADTVVAATGRRGPVPQWLAEIGVEVPETVHESGLMYLTRWYHRPWSTDEIDPKLGGDLGFVKYLGVPGDGDTLSVTLAVRTADSDLRHALSDGARFDQACHVLPGPDQFFAHGTLDPIGDVRPMTGLINRLRRFTDDAGQPTVLGFHALGDAHTTTNPLYGRGCALAVVQATLLAEAFAAHPDDATARATAYEAASAREVEPWFEASVQMDRMGSDPGGSGAIGTGGDGPQSDAAKTMAAIFAAAATHPVIGRGIAKLMNLLIAPAALMSDGEFLSAVAEVIANPDAYPAPERIGPTRAELLDALSVDTAAVAGDLNDHTVDPAL